jgi:hypothetical protein
MTDAASLLAFASAGTLALGVTAVATLKAWHEWLELRRLQLEKRKPTVASRGNELANLRERVKRLEAIANG